MQTLSHLFPSASFFREGSLHEGDIMGIGDRGILAVGQSVEETTKEMLAQLVDEESELISLYFGQDVLEEDAENFAQEVEELYPDVDVDVHIGGITKYLCHLLMTVPDSPQG